MNKLSSFLIIFSSFIIIGCSNNSHTPNRSSLDSDLFSHTVRTPGETLGSIARWYTGSTTNWQTIRDANPYLDPKKIRIGSVISIPRYLMTRTDPPRIAKVDSSKTKQDSFNRSNLEQRDTASSTTSPDSAADQRPDTTIPSAALPEQESQAPSTTADQLAPPDVPETSDITTLPSSVEAETSIPLGNLDEKLPEQPNDPDLAGSNEGAASAPSGGLVSGILEAVGNASLEAKKQAEPKP